MISSNEFKTGLTIEIDDQVFSVVEFLHVKPGKGSAFVRTKLRNVETGATVDRTFRAGEKVTRAMLDKRRVQYIYRSGEEFYFMDNDSYEQFPIYADQLGDVQTYLKEEMTVDLIRFKGRIIGVELPKAVELVVAETEPGVKGDTAAGGTKPATLETGAVVQVPFFINEGDTIRVDTRSGEYVERV